MPAGPKTSEEDEKPLPESFCPVSLAAAQLGGFWGGMHLALFLGTVLVLLTNLPLSPVSPSSQPGSAVKLSCVKSNDQKRSNSGMQASTLCEETTVGSGWKEQWGGVSQGQRDQAL